jgi:Flp pilus assembly protein TadG
MSAIKGNSKGSKARRGAIVVLVAVCLTVVLAFVAIAIDGGSLLERRRLSQATADAAALAAAETLFRNYPKYKGLDDPNGGAVAAAKAIAAGNGFNNDGVKSTVTVRISPETYMGGPNKGKALPKGYVEVTVQYNQGRYFSNVIGAGTMPVIARAVARGKWEPSFVGIHVLDMHGSASLTATGESTVTVSGGAAVIVNSDASDAATSTGGTLIADQFEITGGSSVSGTKGGFFGGLDYGAEPQPDPLRNIPQPISSNYAEQSRGPVQLAAGNRTLSPGVYHGGITITGQANVTMMPGVYYMDGGGFSFGGLGNLLANGVMIYNDPKSSSDNVNISGSGGGSVTITPPTSGPYQGMTLFQNRTATNQLSVTGNGGFSIDGTFYAANALMTVGGNGNSKIGSQYVSRYLSIVGSGGMTIDYNPAQVMPRRVLNLVE